jgi:SAM-dependent methyltransferase
MVRERRRRLCGAAEGRVLDLTGAARAADFRRADEVVCGLEAAATRPESFDTAVAVLWLSGAADTAEALAQVSRALAPGGELVFLEPVRQPGIGRLGQGLVSPVLQRTAGWRVDRDIPALLRDEGWAITDLERIPVPRYLWPLHGLVEGRAHPRVRSAS